MNWLRSKIVNWLKHTNEIELDKYSTIGSPKVEAIESNALSTEPLRLHIYRANGGTIVETRYYNRQRDQQNTQLHIVGHDQDLGQSLAKIITMESLRG